MRVYELGGETDVVGHYRSQRLLIVGIGRFRREDNLEATSAQERVPEGVILVDVQGPRDADDGTGGNSASLRLQSACTRRQAF